MKKYTFHIGKEYRYTPDSCLRFTKGKVYSIAGFDGSMDIELLDDLGVFQSVTIKWFLQNFEPVEDSV
jgi:hypothetical protein